MTKDQGDKLGMYDDVVNQQKANPKATEGMPALNNSYIAFIIIVAAIYTTEQQYRNATKGNSDGKKQSKDEVREFTIMVAGAVLAWATDKKNTVLMTKVKSNKTAVGRASNRNLKVICEWFLNLVNENQAELSEYGLTKEVVAAFGESVEGYKVAEPSVRNGIAMGKAYREKLLALFKEADRILKFKIDMLILPLKKSNLDYYNAYLENRKIKNSATRRTAFRITVKEKETGSIVQGATVSIESIGFESQTDQDGLAMIKPIPLGTYEVVVKKIGYISKTLGEIKTTLGKTNRFEILLEKAK
jgi:Carboxypeptidase regulatory-like domain